MLWRAEGRWPQRHCQYRRLYFRMSHPSTGSLSRVGKRSFAMTRWKLIIPLARDTPLPVMLAMATIPNANSWERIHNVNLDLHAYMTNQPVLDQAGNVQIRRARYTNNRPTYVMLHVIEKVLQSLVLDIVHKWGFLRCQRRTVFWI